MKNKSCLSFLRNLRISLIKAWALERVKRLILRGRQEMNLTMPENFPFLRAERKG